MKKLLWSIGTVIACVLWFLLVGFISFGIIIVVSIATRSEIYAVQSAGMNVMGAMMFLGWIVLIVMSVTMWKRWKIRCPACKRWGAVELEKTEVIKQEDIRVLATTTQRNRNGEVTGTSEQYVPGKRETLRDTYKCKYCGHRESYIRTAKRATI